MTAQSSEATRLLKIAEELFEEGRRAAIENRVDPECRNEIYLAGVRSGRHDWRRFMNETKDDVSSIVGASTPRAKTAAPQVEVVSITKLANKTPPPLKVLPHIPRARPDLDDHDGPSFKSLRCYRFAAGLP